MLTERNQLQSPEPVKVRDISFTQELWRKATHLFALVIPGGYYILGLDKGQALDILVPIAVTITFLDTARLRNWWIWYGFLAKAFARMVRHHEQAGDFSGATYILAATCATVALYNKPIAIAALTFIIVGDSFAAVIGRRFGRHKLFQRKSWEGSLACLFGTLIVAIFAPHLSWQVAVVGAVVAAVVEALPLGVDDNVSVPILSGLAMHLAQKMLGGS